ncbi:MAG: type II secretion system F family protein [Lachnospiraceae bacterium]|nr:type II secretion system F family protein [Lachnospiraceae bacterium]
MLVLFISAAGAVVVYNILWIVFDNGGKTRVKERINMLAIETDIEKIHELVLLEKKQRKIKIPKINIISTKLEDNLIMSGVRLNAREYLIAWFSATFLPIMLFALLEKDLVAVLAAGIIGFAIPPILVRRSKVRKQILFNKQLGEALLIMSNCIRTGYSFQQAMESVANEMQPPISTEFSWIIREISYGVPIEEAMVRMSDRVENTDLNLLISAVLTSSQVGANLSDILDTISDTIKDRIRLREEIRVLSAQGRISGVIIGLLPVVLLLFLMMLNPEYINEFVSTNLGRILLGTGLIMEIIGFMVVSKIVDVKY